MSSRRRWGPCLKFEPRGPREDLFQKLDDTRFNLLLIGQPAPAAAGLRLGDVQIHAIPSDTENDAELAAASIPRPSYYLLRPDGHIELTSDTGSHGRTCASRAGHRRQR